MSHFEIINDSSRWKAITKRFINLDSYFSYEYGALFATKEMGTLIAAYYENDSTRIFYPFIKRVVPYGKDKLYDIVTPYGYGGPILVGAKPSIVDFYKHFSEYCKSNRIITETIRFHPFYENYRYCEQVMDVQYIRQTTSVNLSVPLDTIRGNYTLMNKRNIKKAEKTGLSCFVADKSLENIELFVEMYKETMDRNKASEYYYFNKSFFLEQVKDNDLSKSFILFTRHGSEIIAGTIVLVGQNYGHYHLGASRTAYLDLKPNNFLFDFMIEFCHSLGLKALHLGGGYSEDDGLFKFKSSFTNNQNHPYFIGKKVHSPEEYEKISNEINEFYEVNQTYFPVYRGIIEKKKISTTISTGGD